MLVWGLFTPGVDTVFKPIIMGLLFIKAFAGHGLNQMGAQSKADLKIEGNRPTIVSCGDNRGSVLRRIGEL